MSKLITLNNQPILLNNNYINNNYISYNPLAITGGTVTTSGSYTIRTFTSSGNLIVGSWGTTTSFDVLMIGAGGGGHYDISAAAGGGAGGLLIGTITTLATGTFPINIGGCPGPDNDGQNITFSGFTAYGGKKGHLWIGGNASRSLQTSQYPLSGYTYDGDTDNTHTLGGGGGGTMSAGSGYSPGAGYLSNINGSNQYYGEGGWVGTSYGYGTGGSCANPATAGNQGVVIIRYLT